MAPKKVQLVQLHYLVHSQPKYSSFPIKISKSENLVNVDLITENPQRAALGNHNIDIDPSQTEDQHTQDQLKDYQVVQQGYLL
ncbi:35522_t:CDS:2 [Gigaspora margarita]|uniref:35522_t:CDS:1 n=1 Tax=Gigaspora margarita TaxID=4874 RepID=A0ABN7VR49_GIGMA|nr:35522_t:CDS:2 [Gigaspora margarita]